MNHIKLRLISDLGLIAATVLGSFSTKDPVADAIYMACLIAIAINMERRK